MTHEQTIRAHCAEHGIQIREYPSGTIRFIGHAVDVSFAAWKHATIESLTSYQPRRKRLARAEFTNLPLGASAFDGHAMETGKFPSRS